MDPDVLHSPVPSSDDVVLHGLLERWREDTPAVLVAALVTTDGLPHIASGLDSDGVYLAAVASGLLSSGKNVGPACGSTTKSTVGQVIVETGEELLFVMRAAQGTLLVVVTTLLADAGLIGHEMATLIKSLSSHLGTAPRAAVGGQ